MKSSFFVFSLIPITPQTLLFTRINPITGQSLTHYSTYTFNFLWPTVCQSADGNIKHLKEDTDTTQKRFGWIKKYSKHFQNLFVNSNISKRTFEINYKIMRTKQCNNLPNNLSNFLFQRKNKKEKKKREKTRSSIRSFNLNQKPTKGKKES